MFLQSAKSEVLCKKKKKGAEKAVSTPFHLIVAM